MKVGIINNYSQRTFNQKVTNESPQIPQSNLHSKFDSVAFGMIKYNQLDMPIVVNRNTQKLFDRVIKKLDALDNIVKIELRKITRDIVEIESESLEQMEQLQTHGFIKLKGMADDGCEVTLEHRFMPNKLNPHAVKESYVITATKPTKEGPFSKVYGYGEDPALAEYGEIEPERLEHSYPYFKKTQYGINKWNKDVQKYLKAILNIE